MEKKENKPFIITEEMVMKATDYIPLAEKSAIAKTFAEYCLDEAEVSVEEVQANSVLALPRINQENQARKQLYLLLILLDNYLHVEISDEFADDVYDRYAKSHPFNQLERFKSCGKIELRNKVFDILTDYRELEKMLNAEIFNLKAAKNSTIDRVLAGIGVMMTPEMVQKLSTELQKTIDEVDKTQKKLIENKATAGKPKATTAKEKD